MSQAEDLDGLGRRLDGVGDLPVHAHPDVLEGVHRALVAELEALAGAGSVRGEHGGQAAST